MWKDNTGEGPGEGMGEWRQSLQGAIPPAGFQGFWHFNLNLTKWIEVKSDKKMMTLEDMRLTTYQKGGE